MMIPLGQVSIGTAPAESTAATHGAPAAGGGGATSVGPATGPAATSTAPATTLTGQSGSPVNETQQVAAKPKGMLDMFTGIWPFILIFGVLYLFLFRGQRKDEKNRKKMVAQMKRGDEVMTIGGLVGKVVEVKEDRVVIKVDETTNVKETYLKSAIQRVLTPGDKDKEA